MKIIVGYIVIVILLFASCKKAEERKCWKKKGEMVTQERILESFNHLNLSGGMAYNLIADTINYVVVRAGENLIDFIDTRVEGDVLHVVDNNTCNFLRNLPNDSEVDVHYTSLNTIFNTSYNRVEGHIVKESGFFYWDNWDGATDLNLSFACDTMQIALHTGSPSFVGTGTANFGYLYAAGNAYSDGTNLLFNSGQAHNESLGDIRININGGTLNCVLESGGDIYYTGSPSFLMENDNGPGEIIPF